MQKRPAIKTTLIFMIGILLESVFHCNPIICLLILVIGLLAALALWAIVQRKFRTLDILLIAGLLAAGMLRYSVTLLPQKEMHVSRFTKFDQPVTIIGVVCKSPEQRRDNTLLTISAERLHIDSTNFPCHGKFICRANWRETKLCYGDRIAVTGRLRLPRDRRNPGEFDYRKYLRAQNIHALLYCQKPAEIQIFENNQRNWLCQSIVYPTRRFLVQVIEQTLNGEAAALLKGLLVGARGEIAPEVREAFAKTGVIHVLAISGLHVGFIVVISMSVLGLVRFRYKNRVLGTLVVLLWFVLLTEMRPPVLRASIMAAILMLGTALQRRSDVYNSLAVAALIVLIINPHELFQQGFQLSFCAVLSIAYLYNKLRALFLPKIVGLTEKNKRTAIAILTLFFVSLAAQLGTLPLTAYYFGRIPLISLFANLIVVPAVGCSVAAGYLTALLHVLFPPLSSLYADANWLMLNVTIEVVEWASTLPLAYLKCRQLSVFHIVVFYVMLFFLVNIKNKLYRRRGLIFFLVIVNVVVWGKIFRSPNALEVLIFDVGQGDAILVKFPNKKTMLVDTGPAGFKYNAGKWVIVPYLQREGIDKIDAMIISHPHQDHYGGAAHILRNVGVRSIYESGANITSRPFLMYKHVVDSLGISPHVLRRGNTIDGFDPAQIFVLHPSDKFITQEGRPAYGINNTSVVVKIVFGETSLLLTGDAEREAESAMLHYSPIMQSEILKVGHHGSSTANTKVFLDAVKPEIAVISVGEKNRFNLPSPSVLQEFSKRSINLFRTDSHAAACFVSNGKKWKRRSWKNSVFR